MLFVILIYHNWSSTCIPIALFDLSIRFAKTIEKIISVRSENQSKNIVTVFSRHGKIRTLYISSNWIELFFSLLKKILSKSNMSYPIFGLSQFNAMKYTFND